MDVKAVSKMRLMMTATAMFRGLRHGTGGEVAKR
jgi:hypothetical protein